MTDRTMDPGAIGTTISALLGPCQELINFANCLVRDKVPDEDSTFVGLSWDLGLTQQALLDMRGTWGAAMHGILRHPSASLGVWPTVQGSLTLMMDTFMALRKEMQPIVKSSGKGSLFGTAWTLGLRIKSIQNGRSKVQGHFMTLKVSLSMMKICTALLRNAVAREIHEMRGFLQQEIQTLQAGIQMLKTISSSGSNDESLRQQMVVAMEKLVASARSFHSYSANLPMPQFSSQSQLPLSAAHQVAPQNSPQAHILHQQVPVVPQPQQYYQGPPAPGPYGNPVSLQQAIPSASQKPPSSAQASYIQGHHQIGAPYANTAPNMTPSNYYPAVSPGPPQHPPHIPPSYAYQPYPTHTTPMPAVQHHVSPPTNTTAGVPYPMAPMPAAPASSQATPITNSNIVTSYSTASNITASAPTVPPQLGPSWLPAEEDGHNSAAPPSYSQAVHAGPGHIDENQEEEEEDDDDGDTPPPMISAARIGDLSTIRRLIAGGTSILEVGEHGQSPAFSAAATGHLNCLQYLIENGGDYQSGDDLGFTPLNAASSHGHPEAVRMLVRHRADINKPSARGATPLFCAASRGHFEIVQILVESGVDVNFMPAHDKELVTPVSEAARKGHVDVVRYLVRAGADINIASEDGWRPLANAASENHVETVRYLLSIGADVNASTKSGARPIGMAAFNGHLDVVKLLIQHGTTDCHYRNSSGWTLLHNAASECNTDIVRFLFENGCADQLEARDNDGQTPLYLAAYDSSDLTTLRFLLDHGANVNNANDSNRGPLYAASCQGKLEAARLLLERGARPNTVSTEGWTPLNIAVNSCHIEVARLLLQHGADARIATPKGWSTLHSAATNSEGTSTASRNEAADLVRLIIATGIDINHPGEDGWTPLHHACWRGITGLVRVLLEHGATIFTQNINGMTPLHSAVSNGHVAVVQLLLAHGGTASIHRASHDGWPPIVTAADKGFTQVIELLLDHGAALEARNDDGWTALGMAAARGNPQLVGRLAARGADISAPNKNLWTPINTAANNGRTAVVELLLSLGADPNLPQNTGWTPLHNAADENHMGAARVLVRGGASLTLKNGQGDTPLQVAISKGHKEIEQLLLASSMQQLRF